LFFRGEAKKIKMKKVISIVSVAIILTGVIAPAALAANPRFNFEATDLKTLNVANRTTNSDWQNNSIFANANDQVAFQVYYRNGVADTIARNTRVRLTFPTATQNTITVNVSLSADNAATVTDSVFINSAMAQQLVFETSNVRWFPDRTTNPTVLTASSIGSGYIEVNLGDIGPCWEHQGYVNFYAGLVPVLTPTPTPTLTYNLTISKTARNITAGQTGYNESVNASNNDRLGFQIQVQNIGNVALNNIFIYDTLPSYVSYISGSTRVDGNFQSDGLVSGGINIGSLSAGSSKTITFETEINSSVYSNQTLTNYAYARADQVSERSDTATVYVNQQIIQGSLNISKTARDITTGTNLQSSVNASIGDRIMFLIQVSTPVNVAQVYNVRVWDTLPSGLSYVQGSTRIDNAYTNDSLTSGGLNIGTMSANQSKSLNFEATVNSYGGIQTMTNYAYASADNVGQQSAFAQVIVGNVIYPATTLYSTPTSGLTKYVDNLTSPNGTRSDNTAYVGDTLKYSLSYTNNSNVAIYNVQLWDILPSSATFLSADNNGYYNSANNQATWNMGSLSPGASANVSYQVRVINVPTSNYVIANSAAIKADSFSFISSNEVRTTVIIPVVKGASVVAVTGSNDLPRNIAVSLMVALWGIFFIYLFVENSWMINLGNLKFKYAVWKIRKREKVV